MAVARGKKTARAKKADLMENCMAVMYALLDETMRCEVDDEEDDDASVFILENGVRAVRGNITECQ